MTVDRIYTPGLAQVAYLVADEAAGVTAVIDLSSPRRVHVANVGGAGMSAVAVLLAESGHQVSGHDPAPSTRAQTPKRSASAIAVSIGHTMATIPKTIASAPRTISIFQERLSQSWVMRTILCADERCA